MKRILLLLMLLTEPLLAVDFQDPKAVAAAAVDAHPTVGRLEAEAAAARELIAPAGSLPNPMLMAGLRDQQINFESDEMMTMIMVGISQRVVRPEKRNARREAAQAAVVAIENELASARAEIRRDALLAWYDVAAADAQLHATSHLRELTDAVVAAARVRYEVGTSVQADVIRAQLQASGLELEVLSLRAARRAALARLLPLLGLPMTTEVPLVSMPENTDDLAIDATPVPPSDHPALVALESQIDQLTRAVRLAQLETRPDVDLEAQYGYRALQQDMFSLTARIELPLRAKQLSQPRVREAELRRDAVHQRIEEVRRALTQAMAEAVVAHEEATRQLDFQREVLVPQAQFAFESTLAAYQSGKAPFDAILATQTAYLRLRLQYFDFLSRHAQAVVNYDALRRGARTSVMAASARTRSSATPAANTSMGSM
jgi:outer membrane protein TolC